MTRFEEILDEMKELHNKKSHDYARDEDKFSNFKMVEVLGVCTVEEGFVCRMTDKICRISELLKKEGKVDDERITDTLMDLAIYSVMLKEYMEMKEE